MSKRLNSKGNLIITKIYNLFLLLMNYLVFIYCRSNTKHGVAIIRLDGIGDFVIWLSAAKAFREIYPNQKITLIANSSWAELATKLPYWDKVIELDIGLFYTSWKYRWKYLLKFRTSNYETVIQPIYSRDILRDDSLVMVSDALYRIGWQGDCSHIRPNLKRISDQWYTQLVPATHENELELERNFQFIRHLSSYSYITSLPNIPKLLELSDHLKIQKPYLVIFPSASGTYKQWPSDKFALVAQMLSQEQNWQIVICGGPNDKSICSTVNQMLNFNAIDLSGQTSLLELIEIIRESAFLISNDTSAIHFATAINTPSVCILGGGHFGRFLPLPVSFVQVPTAVYHPMSCFGCHWLCTQPHIDGEALPCIQAITAEDVYDAVMLLCKI